VAYATRLELAVMGGLPTPVLAQFPIADQDAILTLVSGMVDEMIGPQYGAPLSVVPVRLKFHIGRIAAYLLMGTRGFDPERGSDKLIKEGYVEAMAYLDSVRTGGTTLEGAEDATPGVDEGAPYVYSEPLRGW